jgi:hypothetical protein
MPVVMIWEPDDDNKYGHAAVQTDKYHMSFWPKQMKYLKLVVSGGVTAELVYHNLEDKERETDRIPNMYDIKNTTDAQINRVYEDFLEYNGVDCESVTLERGKEMHNSKKDACIPLSKTKYNFRTHLSRRKPGDKVLWLFEQDMYYTWPLNCVSFVYHMIEYADPRPNTTLSAWEALKSWNAYDPAGYPTVNWFQYHVKKNYM